VTQEELASLSSYMRGRMTLEKVRHQTLGQGPTPAVAGAALHARPHARERVRPVDCIHWDQPPRQRYAWRWIT
jgi:hypothetical protein